MTFDDVRACLEKDGWPVDVVSDVTLRSRFRSGDRIFPLFVHLEPEYATFAVIPFARLPADEGGDLLADRLLVLNREINLAKFSVDEDGDVILSVEYPLADLDPSEVRDAVDVLSFYAEKYRTEVEAAAAAGKDES
jgi:Putative bacterial sensory transduction regulator